MTTPIYWVPATPEPKPSAQLYTLSKMVAKHAAREKAQETGLPVGMYVIECPRASMAVILDVLHGTAAWIDKPRM